MGVSGIGLSLRQAVRSNANGIATRTLTADGKMVAAEVTWAELEEKVGLLWSFLERTPVLQRGDRLGVLGRNSTEYLQLSYACADAGVIMVPLNTRWSVHELRHAVVDCGIKVMAVLDREFIGAALDLAATTSPTASPPTSPSPGISSLLLGPQATDLGPASSTPTPSSKAWSEASRAVSSEASRWWVLHIGGIDHAESSLGLERRGTDAPESKLTSAAGDGAREGEGRDFDLDESRCRDSAEGAESGAAGPGAGALNGADVSDIFCIAHTSGSTGRSKGAALTHRGQVLQAAAKCVHIGLSSSTTYLNVMPLFHVGGLSASLAVTMVAGCHVFVPRFSPTTGRAAVQTGRVNYLVAVPTMLHMLISETASDTNSRLSVSESVAASAGADASPLAGVLVVVVGGQVMSRRLERLARDRMPRARFVQTYACSEAGSSITFAASPPLARGGVGEASPADLAHGSTEALGVRNTARENGPWVGAAGGITAEHVEVRVVERGSTGDRHVCLAPDGAIGEVETRGPHVMKGYWGRPDLTAEALRSDGWLRTGDLGRVDKGTGRLVVVGRVKDIIKTGGENVHASEVEDVLLRHDWVAEAAAYGVNDERLGEKVAASVVLDDAAQDQAGAITCDRAKTVLGEFCGLHLSHYKRPRRIDVVPALPKNSAGKVLRHRLRASL